jgi:hypothetical protein
MTFSIPEKYTNSNVYVGLAITIYILLASYRLSDIPLGYDEALFGNAALNIDPDLFRFVKYKDFTILLMDYIGALKSWIYYPIFKIFGVSVWTIRFPMVLLTGISMWFLFKILADNWQKLIASIIVLYLAFDASFLYYTKIDTGPNAIELFIKIVSIYLFLQFVKFNSLKPLLWLSFLLFLGVFNKLNFIWFTNAFYAGIAFAYRSLLWERFKQFGTLKKVNFLVLTVGSFLLAVGYLLVINHYFKVFEQKVGTEKGLLEPLQRVFSLLVDLVGGSGLFVYTYRYGFQEWSSKLTLTQDLVTWFFIISTTIVTLSILIKQKIAENRFYIFSVVVLTALLAQIYVTERARYGWHIFMIYPFVIYVGIYSIQQLFGLLVKNKRLRVNLTVISVGLVFGQILITQYYHLKSMRIGIFRNNSPKIYELANYTKASNKKFVLINASCSTQLITLTQEPDKYFEVSYLFEVSHKFLTQYAKNIDEFNYKFLKKSEDFLFVTTKIYDSPARGEVIKYRDYECYNFFDVLEKYHYKAIKVKDIALDNQGYSIYRIVPDESYTAILEEQKN